MPKDHPASHRATRILTPNCNTPLVYGGIGFEVSDLELVTESIYSGPFGMKFYTCSNGLMSKIKAHAPHYETRVGDGKGNLLGCDDQL